MDYRPPIEGCSVMAVFRVFRDDDPRHCYLVLRMHPPLSAQTRHWVKYRYSLEVKQGLLWDDAAAILFVTSEIDVDAYHRGGEDDHVLGAFDELGHHNLGYSSAWGNLVPFFRRAAGLAAERLQAEVQELRPAVSLETAEGLLCVETDIVSTSIDLQARLLEQGEGATSDL